jgi:signal transduction histidine kinase
MDLSRIRGYLLPDDEQDSQLRAEMIRLSHVGLEILGATEMAAASFIFLAQKITDLTVRVQRNAGKTMAGGRAWQAFFVILVGAATLIIAKTRLGRSHPRALLCLSGWLSSAVFISSSLLLTPHASGAYIPLFIATVMLVALTVSPLRPKDTFLMGLSIWVFYSVFFTAGAYQNAVDLNAWDPSHLLFTLMLTVLSTGLAAVVYNERSRSFLSHGESLRIAQDLYSAQGRALLSENAISVGKLAAALTHELNTPLGALKSATDTMLVMAAKQATAPPEAQERLVTIQAELRKSVNSSIERLKNVIARLQRFIDLDHTERQPADINELLGDLAILFAPDMKEKVKLEFDLRPIPTLTCRPQQIRSVFSSLLSNAIDAVAGEGRIVVTSEKIDSTVQVRIQDNGRGMEPEELENIFDPGFKVTAGRVSTGNWSLFSSRQIVFEHGGDIHISSTPNEGTTVSVILPI